MDFLLDDNHKRKFNEEIDIEKVVFGFYKDSLMEKLMILTKEFFIKQMCIILQVLIFFINCSGVNIDFSR